MIFVTIFAYECFESVYIKFKWGIFFFGPEIHVQHDSLSHGCITSISFHQLPAALRAPSITQPVLHLRSVGQLSSRYEAHQKAFSLVCTLIIEVSQA